MKSSESSTTSMADKKRMEMISPKSVKSEGNCSEANNLIRCFYCTKTNFMTLDQLTHHINIMHSHKLMKEQRKTRSVEHESSHHHHHSHHSHNYGLSCEFCLMKFSSSEKLIKHIRLVHGDKMRSNEEFLSPTKTHNNSEQLLSNEGSKKIANKYDGEEQPTDLSQRIVAAKKIKIENYATIPKQQHFDPPPPTTIRTPGTPDVFLCNQCNASLPSFELFRLHLKNHLEESYGEFY